MLSLMRVSLDEFNNFKGFNVLQQSRFLHLTAESQRIWNVSTWYIKILKDHFILKYITVLIIREQINKLQYLVDISVWTFPWKKNI